jgi:hypothetical protein
MTDCGVKSTIFLSVLAKKNFFTSLKIKLFTISFLVATKMVGQNFFPPTYFFGAVVGSGIRDP